MALTAQGDFVNQYAWQDQSLHVPPSQFNNIPPGTNFVAGQGDGRYWWQGNANSPAPSSATLLLHGDGANNGTVFTDSAVGAHVITTSGGGVTSTTQKEFGTASLKPNAGVANGGFITPNAADINALFAGDFTVSMWVFATGSSVTYNLLSKQAFTSVYPFQLTVTPFSGVINVNGADGTGTTVFNLQSLVNFPINSWQLITVVRFGSTFTLYQNGVAVASSTYAGTLGANTANLNIAQDAGGNAGSVFNGYIDELVMFPSAIYKANFTPPTSPFTPTVLASSINFIGDVAELTQTAVLTWQIQKLSNDGSLPTITYSKDGGTTFTNIVLPNALQALQSGAIDIPLAGATGLLVGVYYTGGTPSGTATNNTIAFAITRNSLEAPAWDFPRTFNPVSYNAQRLDVGTYASQTLAQLRVRLLIDLGFSNQAANPPPGMASFINNKLLGAQNYLYRRYTALHTLRYFRWQVIPGQRFYSLKDNDEDVLANYHLDPAKTIEWVGMQDSRNVWYPLIEGIPPQLYTMIDKPWRPARYAIRQAIELYPTPDQTYWLWMRAHFGLLAFAGDSDQTTIDSELVYLMALANCKAHYGQPDAQNVASQANAYRGELIAGTHKTAHYIPATVAVPPAVRPTLIQFQ